MEKYVGMKMNDRQPKAKIDTNSPSKVQTWNDYKAAKPSHFFKSSTEQRE